MGRLIDAGLFLDNLSGRLEIMKDYDAVKDVINNMPTAYDVDKVVEQLETEDSKIEIQYENNYEKGLLDGIWKAIEIVKGGGIDGN